MERLREQELDVKPQDKKITVASVAKISAGTVGLTGVWALVNPGFWNARVTQLTHNGILAGVSAKDFFEGMIAGKNFRHAVLATDPQLGTHYLVAAGAAAGISSLLVLRKKKAKTETPQTEKQEEESIFEPTFEQTSTNNVSSPSEENVVTPDPKNTDSEPVAPPSFSDVKKVLSGQVPEGRRKYTRKKTLAMENGAVAGHIVFKSVKPIVGNNPGEAGVATQLSDFSKLVGEPIPLTMVDMKSLDSLHEGINAKFPWFKPATDAIFESLIVRAKLHGEITELDMRPILLNGPAGIGKTEWSGRLAKTFGAAHLIVPLGGKDQNSSGGLKSVSRQYVGSGPSVLIKGIKDNQCANPIVVLDELEKCGQGTQDFLLQLLERSSSKDFLDDFLEGTVDLSRVQYIATTNSIDNLSEPLKTRFQIVEVKWPAPEDADIVLEGMEQKLCSQWSITREKLPQIDLLDLVGEMLEEKKSLREVYRAVEDKYTEELKKH